MRDDTDRVAPAEACIGPHDLGLARLVPVTLERQTLISGSGVASGAAGWPQVLSPDGAYSVALRRDRVLQVNGPALPEGWEATNGRAVSDVTVGFVVFDLSGSGAFDLLCRGAELSLDLPSASVQRLLFGMQVMLYRVGAPDRFRLHVDATRATALVGHLEAAAAVARD